MFFIQDSVENDKIDKQEVLNLVSKLLHNEKAEPAERQTVYIIQEICVETGKIILIALLVETSIIEEKDFIFTPEFAKDRPIYRETFTIPEESNEINPVPRRMKLMVGVTETISKQEV